MLGSLACRVQKAVPSSWESSLVFQGREGSSNLRNITQCDGKEQSLTAWLWFVFFFHPLKQGLLLCAGRRLSLVLPTLQVSSLGTSAQWGQFKPGVWCLVRGCAWAAVVCHWTVANHTVCYGGTLNLRLPGSVFGSLAVSFLSNTWNQMLCFEGRQSRVVKIPVCLSWNLRFELCCNRETLVRNNMTTCYNSLQ